MSFLKLSTFLLAFAFCSCKPNPQSSQTASSEPVKKEIFMRMDQALEQSLPKFPNDFFESMSLRTLDFELVGYDYIDSMSIGRAERSRKLYEYFIESEKGMIENPYEYDTITAEGHQALIRSYVDTLRVINHNDSLLKASYKARKAAKIVEVPRYYVSKVLRTIKDPREAGPMQDTVYYTFDKDLKLFTPRQKP